MPIGVYDRPPSDPGISSVRLVSAGAPYYYGTAVRELMTYTRWRDRASTWIHDLIG